MKRRSGKAADPQVERGSKKPKRTKRTRSKNTVDNSVAAQSPPMREGENGGQLQIGNPGNKGGSGRPRNEIREMAMRGYEEALPLLLLMATGRYMKKVAVGDPPMIVEVPCSPKEIKDAATELGNRGIGSKVEVDVPSTPVVFSFLVSPEVAAHQQGNAT